jgi:hypothetical protein
VVGETDAAVSCGFEVGSIVNEWVVADLTENCEFGVGSVIRSGVEVGSSVSEGLVADLAVSIWVVTDQGLSGGDIVESVANPKALARMVKTRMIMSGVSPRKANRSGRWAFR